MELRRADRGGSTPRSQIVTSTSYISSAPDNNSYWIAVARTCRRVGVRCIEFSCQRNTAVPNPTTSSLRDAINANSFDSVLFKYDHCPSTHHLGHCANQTLDENLAECSCPELDRLLYPEIRETYDSAVVDQAIEQISQTRYLSMAAFAPGRLFGEAVIMTKLFDPLRAARITQARIDLSIIDTGYQENIASFCRAYHCSPQEARCCPKPNGTRWDCLDVLTEESSDENSPLHGRAIWEFVKQMTFSVPSGISLSVRVFGSDSDYKTFCRTNSDYKNDLLFGADMSDSNGVIWGLFQGLRGNTQNIGAHAVALQKTTNGRYLWEDGIQIHTWAYPPATATPLNTYQPRFPSTGFSQGYGPGSAPGGGYARTPTQYAPYQPPTSTWNPVNRPSPQVSPPYNSRYVDNSSRASQGYRYPPPSSTTPQRSQSDWQSYSNRDRGGYSASYSRAYDPSQLPQQEFPQSRRHNW